MNYIEGQQMKPEKKSHNLLSITRAKAKMFEYDVPEDGHIKITENPAKLFTISISLLGDFAASVNRGESGDEYLAELKKSLLFSAHFFDAYHQSKLDKMLDPYLMLLGSASYYLCDLPGASSVLIKRLKQKIAHSEVETPCCPDLEGAGLESLLLWVLESKFDSCFKKTDSVFSQFIESISRELYDFFLLGNGENLKIKLSELREYIYSTGSPRQVLLGDLICSIVYKKIQNSTWMCLPEYSGLSKEKWINILKKPSFIKEFWPAQHLLGKADILKGKSAIVQMPTSAGKTKSTELIIRSAFLAERVSLAVVVAPFRALCNEIKNSFIEAFHNESTQVDELSDVLQMDFDISKLLGHTQILVVTPEKLLYVLRHSPDLANNIGLLIFDEGHQFDSGARGITYELLLTSLNSMISSHTQKVLISAVISNAESIGEWLNGEANVVAGNLLAPTFRTIGFASWKDLLGRIEYVDIDNIENNEFFVPRVIEKIKLEKKGRERRDRYFPEKEDGQAIALYLGLKLVSNGSIAVFCGKKSTVTSICEKFIDILERKIHLSIPLELSDTEEVRRLTYLYIANLGEKSSASISAEHGIFSHHGNIPHGIRLAVEHAMRENQIRFVVCTSTLAQGVNLPIRYLILTSIYQAGERIKVRDFHNLIGRAGRSGMHTEGSILFADPVVYDQKIKDKWRWQQVKELIDPAKSEPCISNLLSIFDPIKSDDSNSYISINVLDFVKVYIENPNGLIEWMNEIVKRNSDNNFSHEGVERQISWKINLICSIESFLLSSWGESEDKIPSVDATSLAEETLAFFLADEQKKEEIRSLFRLLAENIASHVTDPTRRKIYGKTLYGIQESNAIVDWLSENINKLVAVQTKEHIFDLLWEILKNYIHNASFNKFNKEDVLMEIAAKWILGCSFDELYKIAESHECKLGKGKRPRKIKIENIVDICEGGIAYDGSLLVSALTEFIPLLGRDDTDELSNYLQKFQKYLKYGLPSETSIALYELGFADRFLSQDLTISLELTATQRLELIQELRNKKEKAKEVMAKYPSYFQNEMLKVLNE